MRVEISEMRPGRFVIKLDGLDVSGAISAFRLDSRAGEVAQLKLEMPIYDAHRAGHSVTGDVDVIIPPEVVNLLTLLGWTPPGDRAPDYVHRLLDAVLRGDPLDFAGATVPADVGARLSAEEGPSPEWFGAARR